MFVEGGIVVPKNKGLMIEPGVTILIKTTEPFIVVGDFDALGTAADPIILEPIAGWEGFQFRPNSSAQTLQYVVIPESAPDPIRVVHAIDAWLRIDHCDFHAMRSCIEMRRENTGCYLQATWNLLRSSAPSSKTVLLDYLANDITDPCDRPVGNRFHDNIVKADAPDTVECTTSEDFTAALYVNGSTNLCLTRNTFSVIAPGSVIGAYFGEVGIEGSQESRLDSADVTVRSYNCVARGVYNALSGWLRVLHCNVDVAVLDHDENFRAAGVLASDLAQVIVNSSVVVLDRDTFFFVAVTGAVLTVDYLTYWSNSAQDLDGLPQQPNGGLEEMLGISDPLMSVEWGEHCYNADPLFLRQGGWGEWQTFEQVAAYYELDAMSPCIDAADVQWGYDPDNTLPDIGRYYFPQPDDVPGDGSEIVTSVALAPAYPNPFNAVTTLPFALNRTGLVRVIAFDVLGREVMRVEPGTLAPGEHRILFDASGFTSGLYLVQVEVDGANAGRQKLILLK